MDTLAVSVLAFAYPVLDRSNEIYDSCNALHTDIKLHTLRFCILWSWKMCDPTLR